MRIQAINTAYDCKHHNKNSSFKGVWGRLGVNYLDETLYHSAAFYPFTNGKHELVSKFYKGSDCKVLASNGMTVEEGSAAYEFLSGTAKNPEGYKASKKLLKFIETLATNDNRHKHNPLFLEKEDYADVNKERMELKISDVQAKLRTYETEHNLIPESGKSADAVQNEPPTEAELWEIIHRTGVA